MGSAEVLARGAAEDRTLSRDVENEAGRAEVEGAGEVRVKERSGAEEEEGSVTTFDLAVVAGAVFFGGTSVVLEALACARCAAAPLPPFPRSASSNPLKSRSPSVSAPVNSRPELSDALPVLLRASGAADAATSSTERGTRRSRAERRGLGGERVLETTSSSEEELMLCAARAEQRNPAKEWRTKYAGKGSSSKEHSQTEVRWIPGSAGLLLCKRKREGRERKKNGGE